MPVPSSPLTASELTAIAAGESDVIELKGLKLCDGDVVNPALPPSPRLRGTGKGGVNKLFKSGFSPVGKNDETPLPTP